MSASPASIRLVIVDDSELVRLGLRTLLDGQDGISVVGEAATAKTAIDACARHQPDVVLLDINLPDGTGIDVCRRLLQGRPSTRVLFLTSTADEHIIDDAIRAGAHGYLLKEINGTALVQAIRDVAVGKSILDPAITARVLGLMRSTAPSTRNALAALSPQESRVLALLADGLTNKEIGEKLGLTEKTVKNYLANVFDKLGTTRRVQAAALYAQQAKPET